MPNPFKKPYTISQPYGPRYDEDSVEPPFRGYAHYHCGIDIYAQPWNTPIYSVTDGVVFQAATDRSDGAIYVVVYDGHGNFIAYWHLSALSVKTGQTVTVGTQLGNQGATGKAFGAHLHLEVQHKYPYGSSLHSPNECIDPTPFLADQGAANDMNTDQLIDDIDRIFGCKWPASIKAQKRDFANMAGNAQQVLLDGAHAGGWLSDWDWNHSALVSYRDCFAIPGDDPNQWATDRQMGGMTFDSQVHQELPPILANSTKADQLAGQVTKLEGQLKTADDQNDELQGKLNDLQNAPQTAQNTSAAINEAECQKRIDEAVVIAQDKAEAAIKAQYAANPLQAFIDWYKSLKIGGGK